MDLLARSYFCKKGHLQSTTEECKPIAQTGTLAGRVITESPPLPRVEAILLTNEPYLSRQPFNSVHASTFLITQVRKEQECDKVIEEEFELIEEKTNKDDSNSISEDEDFAIVNMPVNDFGIYQSLVNDFNTKLAYTTFSQKHLKELVLQELHEASKASIEKCYTDDYQSFCYPLGFYNSLFECGVFKFNNRTYLTDLIHKDHSFINTKVLEVLRYLFVEIKQVGLERVGAILTGGFYDDFTKKLQEYCKRFSQNLDKQQKMSISVPKNSSEYLFSKNEDVFQCVVVVPYALCVNDGDKEMILGYTVLKRIIRLDSKLLTCASSEITDTKILIVYEHATQICSSYEDAKKISNDSHAFDGDPNFIPESEIVFSF